MVKEKEMIEQLEEVRKLSEDGCTYYAMSNGEEIAYTGYWICSIFENGYRIEL